MRRRAREYPARVTQVGATADARTGTFVVERAIRDVASLPSGLVAGVRITSHATGGACGGRESCHSRRKHWWNGDGSAASCSCWTRQATMALRRTVTLVGVDGDRRAGARDSPASREVVTAGAAWLKDSARVEVKP